MYFYDWSWQLLEEPFLPVRKAMCVCAQQNVFKEKRISKLCIFPIRIFFSYQKVEYAMQTTEI